MVNGWIFFFLEIRSSNVYFFLFIYLSILHIENLSINLKHKHKSEHWKIDLKFAMAIIILINTNTSEWSFDPWWWWQGFLFSDSFEKRRSNISNFCYIILLITYSWFQNHFEFSIMIIIIIISLNPYTMMMMRHKRVVVEILSYTHTLEQIFALSFWINLSASLVFLSSSSYKSLRECSSSGFFSFL